MMIGLLVMMAAASRAAASADSLDYSQFEKQLRRYFSEQQTRSIISNLPAKCKIFGFDAGDYSGDGATDVVLSARADDQERKEVGVYFFVADGPAFTLIRTMSRRYIGEPIEVGFSIESGICSVTQKLGEYHWRITGYSFDKSVFRIVTSWETTRLMSGREFTSIGTEVVNTYRENRSSETFFRASDSKVLFKSEFDALPVFPARYKAPGDVNRWIGDSASRQILRGSSSWFGMDDCAAFVSAVWDSARVVFEIRLFDDKLVSDTSVDRSDYLDLWFDVSGRAKVDGSGKPRNGEDDNVLAIRCFPREADSLAMRVALLGNWPAHPGAEKAVRTGAARLDYRSLRIFCSLPRSLFAPFDASTSLSFASVYHDVDFPEHPDWTTVIASSPRFEEGKPASFGRMDFYRADEVPFEREDYRLFPIVGGMDRAGIRH
jgi:hypothetical protein